MSKRYSLGDDATEQAAVNASIPGVSGFVSQTATAASPGIDWTGVTGLLTSITNMFGGSTAALTPAQVATANANIAAFNQQNITKMILIGGGVAMAMFLYFSNKKK